MSGVPRSGTPSVRMIAWSGSRALRETFQVLTASLLAVSIAVFLTGTEVEGGE